MTDYTRFTDLEVLGELKLHAPIRGGAENFALLGTVKHNTTGIGTKAKVGALPAGAMLTRICAVIKTAFNAGTTNVLTVGVTDDTDKYLGSGDITAGTAGSYGKMVIDSFSAATDIYAQYTQTGTAATAGEADIYVGYTVG